MSNEFNSMDGEVRSYEIPTALTPQTKNYIDEASIENETINASGDEKKQSDIEKKLFGADEKHFLPSMLVVASVLLAFHYIGKKQGWLK